MAIGKNSIEWWVGLLMSLVSSKPYYLRHKWYWDGVIPPPPHHQELCRLFWLHLRMFYFVLVAYIWKEQFTLRSSGWSLESLQTDNYKYCKVWFYLFFFSPDLVLLQTHCWMCVCVCVCVLVCIFSFSE